MLNPVEQIFIEIKNYVRFQLTQNLISEEVINLEDLIRDGVNSITFENCSNFVIEMMNNITLKINHSI